MSFLNKPAHKTDTRNRINNMWFYRFVFIGKEKNEKRAYGYNDAETRTYALPFLATDLALTTQYEYDSWGRTTSITYPDGETVSYDYDRGGQLFRMYNVQLTMYNYLDSVLYDKFGAVTSRKYGNGLKMQYAYHPQNRRLTGITTLSGNSQLSHTAYTYDPAGNITQAVSSYPWLAGQTFTETFSYDSTNQLVSAANAQTYALSVTYGDWGKIQEYGLQQTDLANNVTTSQTCTYSYGSLNEGQTTFAPNNINYTDGTNVNEQYGINGSLLRRETHRPGSQPETEHYRFTANGNLQAYMYENLLYVHYGYNDANTRTYKYSFDLNPNWVNGRLESVNFNMHNAMFYPNAYINFNNNGYYTKHYYNGMERIASRLGDQNLQIHTNDPELQDRKDQLDSNIRRNIADITGYEFLPVGEEQTIDDPKPIFELPVIGISNLQPSADGIYYYHPNHLGSTCYVTDENAIVQQGFLYAPFGEITNEHNSNFGNSVIPKYSFNAKELDEETEMYYYEARYYAPPVFTSRDPLFEKYPTISPYTYCANNPVNVIDPTGMEIVIVGDEFYQTKVKEYLNKLSESGKAGKFLVNKAIASNRTFVIANTKADVPMELSENKNATILPFNLSNASGTYDKNNGNVPYTAETTLAHELAHFIFPQKGSLLNDRGENTHIRAGEVLAVEWENRVRKDLNMEERKSYGGLDVYRKEIVESAKYKGYYNMRNKSNYGNNSYSVPNYKSPSFILELRQAYHIGGKYIDRLLVKPSYRHQLRIKFKT